MIFTPRWLLAVALLPLPAAAQPFLYVANQTANTIQVINTRDNSVSNSIPTGFSPASVAISPDGTRAFVPNAGSNSLMVFNTANNALVANLGLGQQAPASVVLSPNGQRIYV